MGGTFVNFILDVSYMLCKSLVIWDLKSATYITTA